MSDEEEYNSEEDEEVVQPTVKLSDLVNKTWHLCRSSHLSSYYEDANYYRKWERTLSTQIQTTFPFDIEIQDQTIDCYITPLGGEREILHILVKLEAGDEIKNIFTGLLYVDHRVDNEEPKRPIILVKGLKGVIREFFYWFNRTFDCKVSNFTLTPLLLVNLFQTMEPLYFQQGTTKPLTLSFTPPEDVKEKGLGEITISIPGDSFPTLRRKLRQQPEVRLYDIIKTQFNERYKISPDSLHLTKVATPIYYASKEGRIKFLKEESIFLVLDGLSNFTK